MEMTFIEHVLIISLPDRHCVCLRNASVYSGTGLRHKCSACRAGVRHQRMFSFRKDYLHRITVNEQSSVTLVNVIAKLELDEQCK